MTQDIRVKLATEIMQVTGTVNSVSVNWTRQGDEWVTVCEKSDDGRYLVEITAITAQAKQYDYTFILYYGLVLITDRTSEDVDRAIYLISQWNNGLITDDEMTEYFGELKGFYNTSDLNRVGSAMNYINDRLTECGYNITIESRNDWKMNEYFTPSDFNTYLSDIDEIRSALATLPTTPQTPTLDRFDYQKANDIERILLDVDFLITQTMNNWFYSGEISSGEV